MLTALIVFLILVVIYLYMIMPGKIAAEKKKPYCGGAKFAHRGLYTADQTVPENSIPAFDAAARAGYGIELDIQLTADGQIVVFHDDNLKRMCGIDKDVVELTLDELQTLRLAGTKEKIPLFSDVLATVKGRVPLIVELKNTRHGAQLCQKALELLRKYCGEFCIESFNPYIVRWFRFYAPDIYRGQLVSTFGKMKKELGGITAFVLSNVLLNTAARPQFIAYDKAGRSLSVRLSHLMGADKIVWTMQGTDDTAAMIRKNDAVIFEHWTPDDREQ